MAFNFDRFAERASKEVAPFAAPPLMHEIVYPQPLQNSVALDFRTLPIQKVRNGISV